MSLIKTKALIKTKPLVNPFIDLSLVLNNMAFGELFSKTRLLTFDGSDNVANWKKINGTNFDLTQSTGADKPKFLATGINNLPALDFDGSTDHLTNSASLNLPGEITVFSVATVDTVGTKRIFSNGSPGLGGFGFGQQDNGQYLFSAYGIKDYISTVSQWINGVPQIFTAVLDSNFDVSFYKNGAFIEKVTHTTGILSTFQEITIGKLISSQFWDGKIGENIIYNRAFSAEEINKMVNTYLSPKWKIV